MKKERVTYAAVVVVMSIMAVFLAGPLITIRTENGWTCSYTGSRKGNTTWLGGVTTSEWAQRSPIEEWLAENHRPIEHNWVKTMGTGYGIFGARSFSHSGAPAVYYFMPELQKRFLGSASTEEIVALIEVLRNGPPSEAKRMVDALNDRMITEM